MSDLLPLKPSDKSDEVLRFLSQRRSSLVKVMNPDAVGPSAEQLEEILTLSARVPDHRKLAPFRFVTFTGDARAQFGEILEARYREVEPELKPHVYAYEAQRFMRAPLVVAVLSTPKLCPKGTPRWEQELTSGAVCFQMLLAARAMGFAAQWLSEWYAYDTAIAKALAMDEGDKVAGFIYIGQANEGPSERARPDIAAMTQSWGLVGKM